MTPRTPGTVSNLVVSQKVAAMAALGLDAKRILGLAGLPAARLEDPHGRLPTEAIVPVWAAAIRLSGDPALALRVGTQLQVGALGTYEYLLRNSETLRQIVERADRFMRLMDDMARVQFIERGDVAALRVYRSGGYAFPPQDVECWFAAALQFARKEVPTLRLLSVRFTHTAPTDPAHYAKHFGCPVGFEAVHNEMHLPIAFLDERPPRADPNLGRVLQEHTEYLLSQLPSADPFVYAVRSKLLEQLRSGAPETAAVARALHVSERTLRRRLRAEGTGYQALLEDLRMQLAGQYVGQTREGFVAIARRLAFSDASAFFRAFKRWTGITPAQYRKRMVEGGTRREGSEQGRFYTRRP
jgi:AraC-like DNA-binding protein